MDLSVVFFFVFLLMLLLLLFGLDVKLLEGAAMSEKFLWVRLERSCSESEAQDDPRRDGPTDAKAARCSAQTTRATFFLHFFRFFSFFGSFFFFVVA